MAHPRSRPRLSCRNTRLPDGLTEKFIEKILALRSSPKVDHLQAEFLTKFVSVDTAPAELRKSRAIEKWLATEVKNEQTNERILLTHEEYNILPRVTFARFVSYCQKLIVDTIGETVPEEALCGSFSGGASTSRQRTKSHPATKYLGKAHVTESAVQWLEPLAQLLPLWLGSDPGPVPESESVRGYDSIKPSWLIERASRSSFRELFSHEIVPGNEMFTVPKNADIDRVACKEPDINMFIQKGIGGYIRRRLRLNGINLNDQSINRSFAREGSLTGNLATLDLSSASDSISRSFVELMLPVSWFTVLDSVRSHVTVIDGVEHRNEMFSSMGNGFTFELQSLLFWVLVRAVRYFEGVSGVISIYGDDIICPAAIVPELIWVMSYFGFTVNTKKSFWTGDFRESCGGHYIDGYDITPFYLKGPLLKLTDVIHVANQLREWARFEGHSILNPEVESIWLWLKHMVPSEFWGGENTSFKYQLVSDDVPKMRLREETVSRGTGTGGYLHWLNATQGRTKASDGVETSSETSGLNRFRCVKVRTPAVPRLTALFYHEVVPTSE